MADEPSADIARGTSAALCEEPLMPRRAGSPLRVEERPLRSAHNRSPLTEVEVDMETLNSFSARRVPWNKGRLTGQRPPLKLREIWAIRTRLQMSSNVRELALFNLAIDSKLRACDLTRLQVQDICWGATWSRERPSCSKKRNDRCSSKSQSKLGKASRPGFPRGGSSPPTICFQVGCMRRRTCRHASTPASFIVGSLR